MITKLFNKDFTLVVIGQIISLFGNAILRFALPLYLLRETGSPTLFGVVTACSFVPMIFLSFLGGILADRTNKRNIMVVLDFLTAITVIGLCLAMGKVAIVPLFIVVLMILYGISGTYQPAVQASIPVLASEENILTAGAVVNQISALANLVGPIVGGVLFGAFGIIPILLISIVCFLTSAVMELFIHIPYEKRKMEDNVMAVVKMDVKDSLHYIKCEKPMLIKIIGIIAGFNMVLSAMLMVGMPVIIIETLQMSDVLLGVAQGVLAMGGLCGGIATAVFGKKLKLSQSPLILLLSSSCVWIMAVPLLLHLPNYISYCIMTVACFLLMALATMFSIQMIATVQAETPKELVGKVISLMMAIAMCAQPIGQAIYGIAFDVLANNVGIIFVVGGLLAAGIASISRKVF